MHGTTLIIVSLGVLVGGSAAGQNRADLEAYKAELASLASEGSWWFTSNAAYMGGEEVAEAYGTHFWLDPGGLSAGGCLWSIRDGRPAGVHWSFFQGWDAARGRPFFYQAHTSGTGTGMGYETQRGPSGSVAEQEFEWVEGPPQRIMHRNEWPDANTHVTRTFIWADGGWTLNRTYTWTRRATGPVPCGRGS